MTLGKYAQRPGGLLRDLNEVGPLGEELSLTDKSVALSLGVL